MLPARGETSGMEDENGLYANPKLAPSIQRLLWDLFSNLLLPQP
jgi:hypothetical protein